MTLLNYSYVEDEDGDYYVTGIRNEDGEDLRVGDSEGYAGTDIHINDWCMRWDDVDRLKEVIALAEQRWRT